MPSRVQEARGRKEEAVKQQEMHGTVGGIEQAHARHERCKRERTGLTGKYNARKVMERKRK